MSEELTPMERFGAALSNYKNDMIGTQEAVAEIFAVVPLILARSPLVGSSLGSNPSDLPTDKTDGPKVGG